MFREWFENNLSDYAEDIASNGADAGYPYITYTSDCVELYEQFSEEIWEALRYDAECLGYDNPMALVATFGRQDMLHDEDQFKNLLVWYMAERTAQELCPDL